MKKNIIAKLMKEILQAKLDGQPYWVIQGLQQQLDLQLKMNAIGDEPFPDGEKQIDNLLNTLGIEKNI